MEVRHTTGTTMDDGTVRRVISISNVKPPHGLRFTEYKRDAVIRAKELVDKYKGNYIRLSELNRYLGTDLSWPSGNGEESIRMPGCRAKMLEVPDLAGRKTGLSGKYRCVLLGPNLVKNLRRMKVKNGVLSAEENKAKVSSESGVKTGKTTRLVKTKAPDRSELYEKAKAKAKAEDAKFAHTMATLETTDEGVGGVKDDDVVAISNKEFHDLISNLNIEGLSKKIDDFILDSKPVATASQSSKQYANLIARLDDVTSKLNKIQQEQERISSRQSQSAIAESSTNHNLHIKLDNILNSICDMAEEQEKTTANTKMDTVDERWKELGTSFIVGSVIIAFALIGASAWMASAF